MRINSILKDKKPFELNKLSKKQKLLLFGTIAILSAFIALYLSLSTMYGKQGTISKLERAISDKDVKKVMSLIKSSDKKLVIDKNNANIFLSYLNKNTNKKTELINVLRKQASLSDFDPSNKKDSCFNYYITLKNAGKKLLIFDDYYFELKPCYVNFSSANANTKLYVNDKHIHTFETDVSDYTYNIPFITGTYKIKAVCETSVGKVENEHITDFICPIDNNGKINNLNYVIQIDAKYLKFNCNLNNTDIYVNGKLAPEQKLNSKYSSLVVIGPADSNTKATLYLQKTFPWGTFKSDSIDINLNTNENAIIINPVTESMLNKAKLTIVDYNKDTIVPALKSETSIDFTYMIDSAANDFNTMKNQNIHFTGNYLYSVINSEKIDFRNEIEDDYNYCLSIESTDYYDQNYATNLVNSIIATSKTGIQHIYQLVYNIKDDTWKVSGFYLNIPNR